MTVLDILIWPNPDLLDVSEPIDVIDDEIRTLAADMMETMYDAEGVGLAAPQVGVKKRLVVVDIAAKDDLTPSEEEPLVLINPEFSNKSGSLEWEEGCLSIPGELGTVTRSAKCTVTYLDLDGNKQTLEAEDLKAVALQHECDHLEGKLFVDYLGRLKRNTIKRKMLRLIAELEEEQAAYNAD